MIHFNKFNLLTMVFITLLYHMELIGGEVFTAISDLEELLVTETKFLNNLDAYIGYEETKIDFLKRRAKEFRREHQLAENDPTGYVSNPINAFLLTKRLTSDWKSIEKIVTEDFASVFLKTIETLKPEVKLPTDEDLNGAAVALVRLQETYNLDTSSVARGELNGIQYSNEMTPDDCFEIGRRLYGSKDYHYSTMWMREAMNRLAVYENFSIATEIDILEYLSNSAYHEENIASALEYTDELLRLSPDHEQAKENKSLIESRIKEGVNTGVNSKPNRPLKTNVTRTYEMLCRNEIHRSPTELSKMKCKYVTNRSPFLKIAPLKLEEACLEPYIAVYHDVMYDSEIEMIQKLAKPKFQRATVGNGDQKRVADFRICKSAFLNDAEHKVFKDVSRRVEDMTGLTVSVLDLLQVANYGIGGHYTPHLDYGTSSNRLVTVLFYMSDVEQGGSTVFPELNVAVRPRKGSAAFWYNFLPSGEGDTKTLHASCPVLIGSKWVSNKWLSIKHQTISHKTRVWQDY